MRKPTKIKRVLTLIGVILFIIFFALSFKIVFDYTQCEGYYPMVEIARSVKHLSLSELKQSADRTTKLLKTGYRENYNQVVNLFTTDDVSDESQIDSYYIFVDSDRYDQLISDLPSSGFNEVKGYLVYNDKKMQDVKLRFRGDNRWHWYFNQKSWRIKTDKNEILNGSRKINLTNATEQSYMIDYLSAFAGQKMDVLSYEAKPVRVFLNNRYMGLYVTVSQTDEYFLRANNKLPSEIYSGDLIRVDDKSNVYGFKGTYLWKLSGMEGWDKMANNNVILETDFSYLSQLISFAEERFDQPFDRDIEKMLDIEKYLKWRACMAILGSAHTDNTHNNRLYFDPSSGKLEPILWDTDAFVYDLRTEDFNLIFTDLDRSIFKNPAYVDKMYAYIWEAINGEVNEEEMLLAIESMHKMIKSDVYSDVYKDYLDKLYMNRSFTNSDYEKSIVKLNQYIIDRYAMIFDSLSLINITQYQSITKNENELSIPLSTKGYSGVNMSAIKLSGINDASVSLYRDINFNNMIDAGDVKVNIKNEHKNLLEMDEILYPSKKYLSSNTESQWRLSVHNSVFYYNYIIDTGDTPARQVGIESIELANSVTGEAIDVEMVSDVTTFDLEEFTFTTHPWEIETQNESQNIVFDAGEHILKEDLIIDKNSSLTIDQGAVLKLDKDVSVYVFGQLYIDGIKDNPVIIEPLNKGIPWGVFAIQGHYNPDYSHEIDHAIIRGGGVPQSYENAIYTGMVSAYNTNLIITNTSIIGNRIGDDGFNAKQGNVVIEKCTFKDAFSDAIDLDYATGSINNT